MSSVIEKLEREQLRRLPDFRAGDRVRVHLQVVEGSRRRTQVFEGVVIARSGHGVRETVTVRKQSFGVGVERVFPLHSPKIEKIEVAGRGDVRRAKLYYLRERVGRRARVRERTDLGPEQEIQRELLEGPPPVEEAETEAAEAPEGEAVVEPAEATPDGESSVETEAAADGEEAAIETGADEVEAEAADAPESAAEPDAAAEADSPDEGSAEEGDGADVPAEGESAEEGA